MKELLIYSKSNWEEGFISGGYISDDSGLVNKLKELDSNEFSDPITSNWQKTINIDEYSTVSFDENTQKLSVKKLTTDKYITEDQFCKLETKFTQFGINNTRQDLFIINFNWKAYKTNFVETGRIRVSDDTTGTYQDIVLSNQSNIKLITFDGTNTYTDLIIDTDPQSIGQIENFISNEIQDGFFDLQLIYNTVESKYYIYTRLRGSGYVSQWYSRPFGVNRANKLELILDANPDINAIVDKELTIKNIFIEGYEDGVIFESPVFDSLENDTIWNKVEFSGIFPLNTLNGYESETNLLRFDIFSSNNRETIKNTTPIEVVVAPTNGLYTFLDDITNLNNGTELKGRYLFVTIRPSINRYFQNKIDYIKFNYTLPSEITGEQGVEVTEVTTSKQIGVTGGIIELDAPYFSSRLYIPEGALDQLTTITIRRIPTSEDIIAPDMIGFEFTPNGLQFKKPVLLEVEYNNFKFGPYQSEDGLKLAYLNADEPEELPTVLERNSKVALAYINHFSIYALMATDNLYTIRTQTMADNLPRWMKLRNKDSNFQKIVNYAAARPLDEYENKIYQILNSKFLDRIDKNLMYISFKTKINNFLKDNQPLKIDDPEKYIAKYKGKYIPITLSEVEFTISKEEKCFLNTENNMIYFIQPYKHNTTENDNNLKIIKKETNEEFFLMRKLITHNIWNPFDEFGFVFDLERLPGEDNSSYKNRIFDVNKNPGNATKKGLHNHIARELGLDKEQIKIHSLNDEEYIQSLFNPDGTPSKELLSIIQYIKKQVPLFWNEFIWDEGYWDTVDKNGLGYAFIPTITDAKELT